MNTGVRSRHVPNIPFMSVTSSGTRKRARLEEDSLKSSKPRKRKKASEEKKPEFEPAARGAASKRSEEFVRNEMLANGALLLEFHIDRDGFAKADLARWRAIEKKGFLVTDRGCLLPASCHWFDNRPKSVGYDRALKFFEGKERDPSSAGSTNEHGWSCEDTVSHLCHRNRCCSYLHVNLEPKWKNFKRNYCGVDGRCDCGMDPPCVETYHPPSFVRQSDRLLTYGTPDLSSKVKRLFERPGVKVKILPLTHYRKQDLKRKNRKRRIKGSIKTAKETK